MKRIITGTFEGKKIEMTADNDFQAMIIIDQLSRDGVQDINLRQEKEPRESRLPHRLKGLHNPSITN